jgi:hypothetical protein
MENKKKDSKTKKPTTRYNLGNIRQLIDQGKVNIRPNALRSAFDDFGWGIDDIKNAIKKLQPKHYYKPEAHRDNTDITLNYYKARGINNEDIYTHFYIDPDGILIISSFKRK